MAAVLWGTEPDEHDYPAAEDYLALLATPAQVSEIVAALKAAPVVFKKAKDLLRASRLPLLPADDAHVARDLKKIKKGKQLSPILAGPRQPEHRCGDADRRRLPPGVCELLHRRKHDIPVKIVSARGAAWGFGQALRRGKVLGVQRVLLLGRRGGA